MLSDEDLLTLYKWIDSIPLTREKKIYQEIFGWSPHGRNNETLLS